MHDNISDDKIHNRNIFAPATPVIASPKADAAPKPGTLAFGNFPFVLIAILLLFLVFLYVFFVPAIFW